MTDQETPQHDETSEPQGEANASSGGKVNIARVLLIAVVGVVIFAGLLGGVYYDLPAKFQATTLPDRFSGSGVATWEGVPLTGGTVIFYPDRKGLRPSVGFIGEGGAFELKTDIQGRFEDGAYPGEHRVTVEHYGVDAPLGAPPATPTKYAERETTPLRFTVSKVPEDNKYMIDLKGKPTRGNSIPKVLGRPTDDEDASSRGDAPEGDESASERPPRGESPGDESPGDEGPSDEGSREKESGD